MIWTHSPFLIINLINKKDSPKAVGFDTLFSFSIVSKRVVFEMALNYLFKNITDPKRVIIVCFLSFHFQSFYNSLLFALD